MSAFTMPIRARSAFSTTAVRTLRDLPVLFVGVRCPLEIIMARRAADPQGGHYTTAPEPVRRWQEAVHRPGVYDLELDTSEVSPEQAAERIAAALADPPQPSAFARLAGVGRQHRRADAVHRHCASGWRGRRGPGARTSRWIFK